MVVNVLHAGQRDNGSCNSHCGKVNVTVVHVLVTVLQVNVAVDRGHSLGLTVRGGRDYGLGIYISGVDPYSVAENAGLKVSGLCIVCFVCCCFCCLLVAGLC